MHQLPGWFCVLVAGSMAAHITSSYIRTKVESMNRRFQKDKPLTRATFHVCLLAVCVVELLAPLIVDVDLERIIFLQLCFEELVFFIGVLLLVCGPTIYTCLQRFGHSYTIFSKDG